MVRPDMEPRELIQAWVDAFNRTDVQALAGFYSENAINHQVAEAPVVGRNAIRGGLGSSLPFTHLCYSSITGDAYPIGRARHRDRVGIRLSQPRLDGHFMREVESGELRVKG